jgi:hypothetical protein
MANSKGGGVGRKINGLSKIYLPKALIDFKEKFRKVRVIVMWLEANAKQLYYFILLFHDDQLFSTEILKKCEKLPRTCFFLMGAKLFPP